VSKVKAVGKNIIEAMMLGVIVTVSSVGFLTLCGVCTINWSMFIW